MSRRIVKSLVCAALALAAIGAPSLASAQERHADAVTRPDRALLTSGIWTLGIAYVPAVIVATESSLPADRHLYVPVAGPWLNYANRDCADCQHETANKVMLVTDGIFQGIGALQILGSFIFPETQYRPASAAKAPAKPARLRVAPARLASGYGLIAKGAF